MKNLEAPEELKAPVHETQQNLQASNKVKLPLWSVQPSACSPSLVKIPLKIGNLNCVALLDSSAAKSCISKNIAKKLKLHTQPTNTILIVANSTRMQARVANDVPLEI